MATPAQVAANQANSQSSTGPKTPEGKARSSRNSFKHGLYAQALVLPGEDPAELDQIRSRLSAEHSPGNLTEEILVNELAENFWRIRRMREREAVAMLPENVVNWLEWGLIALIQRTMASAERAFHRSLADLRRLQKDRGFVPQPADALQEPIGFVSENSAEGAEPTGFVPQNPINSVWPVGFVPENSTLEAILRFREQYRARQKDGLEAA